jgi:hypothetical protein
MKNIKNEHYFVDSIPNNNWYRTQRDCYPFNRFGKKKLDERRKYEVLKHTANKSNLTRAQQYSSINNRRSLVRNCNNVEPKFFSPSASNVPGKWDINVDSNFLNIPVTNIAVRNQYTSGPSGKYNYFNSTPQNFKIPFKILSTEKINVSFKSINDSNKIGLSFELINDNSYSINDMSNATLYINELGAIRDDNKGYSSNINDWVLPGNSSIYGRFYTTATNGVYSDISDVAIKMLKYKLLEYNYLYAISSDSSPNTDYSAISREIFESNITYQYEEDWVIENLFNNLLNQTINETITNDNSFNDISNNHYVYQLLNQYIECRTSDFSGHDLHIKLSKTDGSDEYLTGYLGKKDNKVYFIGDRNDIRYDISSLLLESTTTNTFPINTLLNMSLYNYGFETKLKLC